MNRAWTWTGLAVAGILVCSCADGRLASNDTGATDPGDDVSADSTAPDGSTDASGPDAGDTGTSCVDGLTQPCGEAQGICSKGTRKCKNGEWSDCMGSTGPSQESCDGRDNDCDGRIDEECPCSDGETQQCGPSEGSCTPGTQQCSGGSWGTCSGVQGASSEMCDNKDNDCDGATDENLTKPCYTGPTGTLGRGVCERGTHSCSSGSYGPCQNETTPSSESCNDKDDDCDGQTDEEDACAIWRLKSGSNNWERFSLDPKNSTHAPSKPIRAAFDIEAKDKIYVLTNSTYRVFRPSALTWEAPKALTNLASGLSGLEVVSATTSPASHSNRSPGEDSVTVVGWTGSEGKYWIGEYEPSSSSVTWSTSKKTLPTRTHPKAPPSIDEETALWIDLNNSRGWAKANPKQLCGMDKNVSATRISVYMGFLARNTFYVYDAGYCQEWTENYAYSQSPLAQLNRPPPSFSMIGAASYHQGDLYLFRGK